MRGDAKSRHNAQENIALCEVLDRVLNKGVVVTGEATISVANVELIYINLRLLVASMDTIIRAGKQS